MDEVAGNDSPLPPRIGGEARLLILVRHGRTAWNQERRFLGKTDVPLDEVGRAEARHLARHLAPLGVGAVHSSPLSRARDTAAEVARARGLEVQVDPDLAELDQGELEGQPGSALAQRYPALLARWLVDPGPVCLPGGESLAGCQARALAALERIAAGAPAGAPTVVVSHQMVIAATLCALQGQPLRRFRDMGHDHTAYSVLERLPATWRVHAVAVRVHLSPTG